MDIEDAEINNVSIEQGAWVDNIPEAGDLRLKVRGINNSDWARLNSSLAAAVPRAKKPGGIIDAAERERIFDQCLLETCLLDWDNLHKGGQKLSYTPERARELLSNPRLRDWFRGALAHAATWVGKQAEEQAADAEKN
jgi:hypothetical protein